MTSPGVSLAFVSVIERFQIPQQVGSVVKTSYGTSYLRLVVGDDHTDGTFGRRFFGDITYRVRTWDYDMNSSFLE